MTNRLFSLKALLLAIATVYLGILCTYYLATQVKNQFQTQSYTRLEAIGKKISIQVQESIDIAVNDLRALQAFYFSSEQVTADEFNTYTQALLDTNPAHIQALEWIPRVTDDEREKFEARLQIHYPGFHITERNSAGQLVPSVKKNHYYPVTYIAPYNTNYMAHGFDLNSNATRRASLNFARDSGEFAATARIRLVQEQTDTFGFLIFAPIYSKGQALDDAGDRDRALQGFVLGVFRIDSLIKNAQNQANDESLALALLDSAEKKETLLYGKTNDASFHFNLKVPARHWQLRISLSKALQAKNQSPSVANWIMGGGITVSTLLGLCLYALMHMTSSTRHIKQLSQQVQIQNVELEATVSERTKALAQKNQVLNHHVDKLITQRKILSSLMEDTQAAKDNAEKRATELARSNRDLDDFAYVASHGLKSPLRGIDQLASWVIEDFEANNMKEIPENLRMMRQRVQRLESLLNDLLAYSRIGRHEEKITRVNCHTLFNDIFILCSPPPNFRLSIHGKLPIFSTITAPFEQVIRNLLNNAIKHHHRVDGHIQVRCCEHSEHYEFSIQDDGPGIDPNYHEQIFKMFKTLKPRDETEGSGMGLAFIKNC